MPDDDFDFEANEEQLTKDEDDSSVNVDNEKDDEEYLDDDEAYMDDKGADLDMEMDDTEDEDEEAEDDAGAIGDPKPDVKPTDDGTEDPYSKIREDILTQVEEETMLKIKDKELRAGDLSKEELVMYLQKGIRADDLFNENADVRRQLENERALVTKGAQAVESLLAQQGSGQTRQVNESLNVVLEKLKPTQYDTDSEKTLKLLATELVQKVDTLERDVQQGQVNTYESAVVGEIKALKKQFPLASVDEVLAVKTSHPDASLERLMEAGHNYYSGSEFINEALSANPQAKREYDDKVIRDYNAKKGGRKNVPLKRSRTSGSKKVSTGSRPKVGISFDFDNAESLGKEYLNEVAKSV